ncbi:nitrogenase component 1 [Clostridium neonatale]|uniref:Nitrogenase molybdenum-iron protein n=1 Tax=Clostridium neonatale TaxID=137838 RepID=A0AAD2DGF3_9CLOT|nr:nitrogenase component 1 [Clostridium neonatale]CAI3192117.1 putative nitrogenase molybdenum-iron protein [Clostridium neonatale]CAI3208776.1 putative nitrogenase molybdenum-iron protein [Clostridium neonatale]CAI3213117.1 putative nitrogenase molybdenum-iron protein [Clostridium neonatale]CAI3238716.1 putative nitrogenase molybdenum-iron protein [Clostridium neonatale]CAI3242841.1 putative nitrogenase molybdenum-iron protein [Clostridium neonatale]
MSENLCVNGQTNSINQVRYGCALGALHSVVAIPGAMPITHCGPGCVDKQYTSLAFYNGFQGGGYAGGSVTPSVNAGEREVIFGGENRLRKLIKSSLRILDAELFVVLNGCIGEIVGDDIGSVVGEFQKQDIPIVYAETGGFKGNNFIGHEIIVESIINQYVDKFAENKDVKEKGLINVWSELPYQNTFWRGDLGEIKRILEGAGFKVNILFGNESAGVSEWKKIPNAQFNLVISPWMGVKIAKLLEKKYNQSYLHVPVLPIGAKETSRFLNEVVQFAKIDSEIAQKFIQSEEKNYYSYLEQFGDFYAEYWWGLPASYAVVGDSTYNLALNKFLVNQLGLIPGKQIITDNTPEKFRESIRKEYEHLAEDVKAEVDFVEDGYIVNRLLREGEYGHKPPIIFGTTWERDVAKELKGQIVEVGFPASYEVVINKSYVGYRGALTLLEKIYTTAISTSA